MNTRTVQSGGDEIDNVYRLANSILLSTPLHIFPRIFARYSLKNLNEIRRESVNHVLLFLQSTAYIVGEYYRFFSSILFPAYLSRQPFHADKKWEPEKI